MKSHLEIRADSAGRMAEVDYLKGFSILTIALMHLLQMMPDMPQKIITLSAIGGTGVHVFFLCSGIGLYTSYLKRRVSFGEFIGKRFLRIYIPYIIVVLIAFFIPWMYSGEDRVSALLSHVFLYKMFVPGYTESFGVHFWFISTIFQLYVLFIPMCRLKEKLSGRVFVLIFGGISVAWWLLCCCLGIGDVRIWGSFCLQYIWEFALGFVIAERVHNGKTYKLDYWLLLVLAAAGIGLQAVMVMYSESLRVFNDIPALVGYASLALLLSGIPLVRWLCCRLSSFSYEFYLLHIPVFASVFRLIDPQGLPMQCVVGCVSMTIALATAFFYGRFIKAFSGRLNS